MNLWKRFWWKRLWRWWDKHLCKHFGHMWTLICVRNDGVLSYINEECARCQRFRQRSTTMGRPNTWIELTREQREQIPKGHIGAFK